MRGRHWRWAGARLTRCEERPFLLSAGATHHLTPFARASSFFLAWCVTRADLIAHACATMLLVRLGLVKKTIKAGPDSGYEADSDIPLEYELWASLRNNFFAAAPPPFDSWKSQLDFTVDVASRGLHISQACDGVVREAALLEFGSMYLGCIH